VTHRIELFLILTTAGGSQGAEVDLVLPPSDKWVEMADTMPLPSAKATSRSFRNKERPELGLRVVTNPSRKLDYPPGVVKEMAERLRSQEGRRVTILEASSITLSGVAAAKLVTMEGETKTLSYHLPGEEGDEIISLTGPEWDSATEAEITAVVMSAKGLRASVLSRGGAPGIDTGVGLLAIVGVSFLLTIGLLVWGLRRKSAVP